MKYQVLISGKSEKKKEKKISFGQNSTIEQWTPKSDYSPTLFAIQPTLEMVCIEMDFMT